MALYETIFIARQDIAPAQVEALTEHFSNIIVENQGQVLKKEQCGLRSLAYKIKKNRKGHYVLMNIDAPAEALHEMERNMRLHEDILRYMSIQVEELDSNPSALLLNKSRRHSGDDYSDYENTPSEA